jgi:adenylate cyclase
MYLRGNQLLDAMELKTYDMRLAAQGTRVPSGDVVIAAIDEQSLATLGRWPWSRVVLADLIGKLDALGARVIALDAFFPESENEALLRQIEKLESDQHVSGKNSPFASLKRALAADAALGQAIAVSGKVVLSMVFLMSEDEARQRPPGESDEAFAHVKDQAVRAFQVSGDTGLDFLMVEPAGLMANLPQIRSSAQYTGHINSIPDLDGTLRWAPLIIRYKDLFFPSADVQAVRAYLGAEDIILHTTDYGITALQIGNRLINTDESGRALIHYYGPEQTIPTISISDLMNGNVPAEKIKGKIVLIGATAEGIGDIRVTPYGPIFPGVEIRASTMQNILDSDFVNRPGWMLAVDALLIISLGALLAYAMPRMGMWSGAGLTLALLAVYLSIAVVVFRVQLVWLNLVYPSVLVLALFVTSTIAKYLSAETGKRQIKSAFQHYVPPAVVDDIIDNVERLRLGGEKRVLTVLFSDIRGFTSVAQSLAPEELVRLLNVYLTQMTEKVFKHDGLLDKYIGDAIMAVYGAPIRRDDHAVLACRTALDMLDELRHLQATWKEQGLPILDIGIGINTGAMVVGNMGSENRFDYTVIGDSVNLGSRIETLNKTYGTHILMSEFTYVMHADGYASMDWLAEYQRAYELVRRNEPDQAIPIFEHLRKAVNDPVSSYYLRTAHLPLPQG